MLLVEAHPLFIDSQLLSLERGIPSGLLLLMLSRGSKPAVAYVRALLRGGNRRFAAPEWRDRLA